MAGEISGVDAVSDFLLELLCEEIPARMQAGARAELEKLWLREMQAAGVAAGDVTVWSTPRRLALIARGLPLATEAVSEEAKGPPEGAPDAAIDGFCRKAGVARDQLELRDVKGRMTYFAVIAQPGRAMAEVLGAAIPAIIRDFSWPKSMRWGEASIATDSLRWVRALSGIVALLDGEVVECEVGGIVAGRETYGHRFHSAGAITIDGADDYAAKLRAAHVIIDHEERAAIIRDGAAAAAAEAGLMLVADEGLVVENAGLTEWPVPLLGRFDAAFLEVPPEVIQLTARVNQKYFVCQDDAGKLANAFICTANIAAHDPAVVVDGNRKVLAARLSDARFFWEQDQKKALAEHAEGLARITFHEKLGTVADKVERVAKLARWLCEEGIVAGDPDMAELAAKLCKADLVTEMVGEFPELQGLMGGYYARAEGLADEVADAIRDHYKPVGQGDDVPTAPVTVAVSLADKLDTLFSFFGIGELPTGSKDPFALRRAGIAVIRLIESNSLQFRVNAAARYWNDANSVGPGIAVEDFLHDRLGVMMRDDGVRYDIVQASTDLGTQSDGNIWRVRRRAEALQAFITTEDGTNLLAGYKRAANILKKEGYSVTPAQAGAQNDEAKLDSGLRRNDGIAQTGEEDPLALVDDPEMAEIVAEQAAQRRSAASALSYSPEPAEKALIDALDAAAPQAAAAVEAERFADAMAALATLRGPIDRFFEDVIVNAPEADKRESRLALLARFRVAVHRVADFSRIEG
jgi:glycyl-tRNA synthetase beta chain